MKLRVQGPSVTQGHYFIIGTNEILDSTIARKLNLSLEEYHEILETHGAIRSENSTECNFKNKEDATKALIALEPHIVMQALVGEV